MSDPELDQRIQELAKAQLVVEESAGQFAFRHALMREAVYNTLLRSERKKLHRAIAETMEQMYADSLDLYSDERAKRPRHCMRRARRWAVIRGRWRRRTTWRGRRAPPCTGSGDRFTSKWVISLRRGKITSRRSRRPGARATERPNGRA